MFLDGSSEAEAGVKLGGQKERTDQRAMTVKVGMAEATGIEFAIVSRHFRAQARCRQRIGMAVSRWGSALRVRQRATSTRTGASTRAHRRACILLVTDTLTHRYYALTRKGLPRAALGTGDVRVGVTDRMRRCQLFHRLTTPKPTPQRSHRCLDMTVARLTRCRCRSRRSSVGSERLRQSLLCSAVTACAS